MRGVTALAIAILLCGGHARAQEAPPAPAADAEAHALYETAMRLADEGKTEEARATLRALVARFPQSGWAEAARGRLREMEPTRVVPDLRLPARLRAPNNPDPVETGRWELILGQTALGFYYGLALAAVADNTNENAAIWGGLGASLASLAATVLATRDFQLHDGYSHLHLSFQSFAVLDALLLLATGEVDEPNAYLGAGVGAGLVGMGVAIALGERLDVPRGQAEFATGAGYFGFWTGLAFSVLAAGEPDSAAAITAPTLVAGNLGLVLGAYAAPRLRWGKWRVRLVELGAVLGGGLGLATLTSAHPDDARTVVGTVYGFSLAGAIAAALATSGFNTGSAEPAGVRSSTTLAPTVLATTEGQVPGLVVAGRW
jgi:hypothetical protein